MAGRTGDNPFWTFSLATYGVAGVAPACIALQNRHGIDVNVLLFCLWMGASGRGALSAAELAAALDVAGPWNREVVCRLRAARRWIKDSARGVDPARAESLRRRIVDLEVACERAEQGALWDLAAPRRPAARPARRRAAAAAANLALYFARLGVVLDEADCTHLTAVAAAALPELDRAQLEKALAQATGAGR